MYFSPKFHKSTLSRLTARKDYLYIRDQKNSYARPCLVLQAAQRESYKNTGEEYKGTVEGDEKAEDTESGLIRMGITVSKNVDKRAVRRNRLKRRLRAAGSDILGHRARAGYDYVIIGRRRALTSSYDQLQKDLITCLKALGLLLPPDSSDGPDEHVSGCEDKKLPNIPKEPGA